MKIEEDESCYPSRKTFSIEVIFSTCFDDEFTCDDGVCINMTKRCDNIENCPNDKSDEVKCELLALPAGYRKAFVFLWISLTY